MTTRDSHRGHIENEKCKDQNERLEIQSKSKGKVSVFWEINIFIIIKNEG